MDNKYLITQEQFDDIKHFKRMFELNADLIRDLCNSERADVVYGFELGQRYSHLRECFLNMMELEGEINKQNVCQ